MRAPTSRPFEIRRASAGDLERLCDFAEQYLAKLRADASAEYARRVLERVMNAPELGVVLVAEHESGICGYAYASYQWRSEFGGETMDIIEMFVEESWRNKGVGGSLIGALIDTARDRHIHRISAEVHPGNAAIERTLESSGFDPERRTLWGMRI